VSNYWVFGANQSINPYFAAISRHQGWFPYFSAGPVGRHAVKRGTAQIPQVAQELQSPDHSAKMLSINNYFLNLHRRGNNE